MKNVVCTLSSFTLTLRSALFTLILFSRLKGRHKQEALKASVHNNNNNNKSFFVCFVLKLQAPGYYPLKKCQIHVKK